jgi:hypothetical protein
MRRLGFIDVTLRDGHQCLRATRMASAMMALGPDADDEDILMAAFYHKEIPAPLEKQAAKSYTYRTSPLMELIQYVGLKPDFRRVRIRFAGAELQVAR